MVNYRVQRIVVTTGTSSDMLFPAQSVAKNPYAASNRAVEKPQEPLKPPMPVITPSRTDPQPEPPTVTRYYIRQLGSVE